MTRYALIPVALIAAASPVAAQHQHADDVGVVRFEVSCAPDVRADFDRTAAMLHHMMYAQARESFRAIARRDASCAMAHWGDAMTWLHPLWHAPSPQDLAEGARAIARARELGPNTPREEALVAAAEAFFRDPAAEGPWWPRLERWSDVLERAHAERPDDNEIAAWYALSELATGQVAEDRMAHNARAAKVLLAIHEREPKHPGASHYTIHANDVTSRAGQSLEIVRGYDEIAPSVPHALHMPTHIFVRLEDWPAVIEWNRKSADAALATPAGDRVSLHYIHALDYLLFAYIKQERWDRAKAVLDEAMAAGPYEDDFASAFHLAAMPARYYIATGDWESAARIQPRSRDDVTWDRFVWAEAISWFARGLGAAHLGDAGSASASLARLEQLRDRARAEGASDFAKYIEIDRLILSGVRLAESGDTAGAQAALEAAVELEGQVQKHPVTPGAVVTPRLVLRQILGN